MLHRQLIKTAHCSSPSKRTYIHAVSIRPRLADHYALQATQLRQRRMFFGIGELLGVITNPGDVLRSLSESRKLLEEARQEMKENAERAQIPPSHTFSPLPGFFKRENEIKALERALGGVPGFTVLFGASSVGKTALLRQVLSSDRFHVIHFDLRIAGFADLSSLYFSLSHQFESYFAILPELMGTGWGWEEFEKESWAFKHNRLALEKRIEAGGEVKTSDIAKLMELLQSSLLKYWDFQPMTDKARKALAEEAVKDGKVGSSQDLAEEKLREGFGKSDADLKEARTIPQENGGDGVVAEDEAELKPPSKKIPVFFLDEAHKLPALIQAEDAMKSLLDSMLVLTKQDRLCHVLHATSDSFYMHWLRQLNIMQHCHILSIGDCSKAEARRYFEEDLLPHVPQQLQSGLVFDDLYRVFGGKLAHLSDYTTEYCNNDGLLTPLQSSHFLQAHSLLNLHLIHSLPNSSSPTQGFQIYSALNTSSPHAPSPFDASTSPERPFTSEHLLLVMSRLTGNVDEIGYFPLCRELGANAVDSMVRGRILELRWSATVTEEGETRGKRVVGPVVVPTTAVVRFAMGEVLREYKEV